MIFQSKTCYKWGFLGLSSLLSSFSLWAYIPAYSMIVSSLAGTQGRGGYYIEQEVVFKLSGRSLVLMEKWWLNSSSQMRLDVSSPENKKLYLRFIYRKNTKIFKDTQGKIQKQPISLYHLDKPFHLRSSKELTRLFYLWKLAPLKIPERKPGQSTDSFVTLGRKHGVVQYKITTGKSELWIEQDEFVIREWTMPEGIRLTASHYNTYPRNLFFPSKRQIHWSYMEADIQVKKIESLTSGESLFQIKRLIKKNHLPEIFDVSVRGRINEFYNQFR